MPENWKTYNWGNLATLEYGKGLRDYRRNQGDYRVYGTNGAIGWHCEALCKHAGIVIGRKGAYRGVHYSNEPFYVIDTAFYLKPKQNIEIDLKWAYYELLTKDINGMDSGSAIPSTTRESFYQLPVKVPPIEEQRRIAKILSALDKKIELNLEMNRTLERIAQATFKHWFVDFQFPDFDGEVVDGLPKGWKVEKLENVGKIINGSAFKSEDFKQDGIFMLRSQNITDDGNIDKKNPLYLDESKLALHKQQILEAYDYLMVMVGASLGKQGIVRKHNLPALLNQNMWNFRSTSLPRQFFNYSLKNNLYKMLGFASGSARDFVRKSDYYKLEIVIPSENLLNLFEEIIKPIEDKISNNLEEAQTLTHIRDGLLPKLMSGKIRVDK